MAALTPALEAGSSTLWEAWFDAGHRRLLDADQLRYRDRSLHGEPHSAPSLFEDCRYAQEWFAKAAREAGTLPPGIYRLGISKSGHAWASYWLGERSISVASAVESLSCMEKLKSNPLRQNETAHVQLAAARAHLIVGESAFEEGKNNEATQHFGESLRAFLRHSSPTPDVAFLFDRQGQLQVRAGQSHLAIAAFQAAEATLKGIGGHIPKRGSLLATIADNQILDGQYRQAAAQFVSWTALWELDTRDLRGRGPDELLAIAQGAVVFVRSFSMLGDLARAQRCVDLADQAFSQMPRTHADLMAGLESQRAEILRMRGHLSAALKAAQRIAPEAAVQPLTRMRAWLARAEVHFEMGNWDLAQQCLVQAQSTADNVPSGKLTEQIRIRIGAVRLDTVRSRISQATQKSAAIIQELERNGRVAQPEMAFAMHALSEALLKDNRNEEAYPIAHRAHALLLSSVGGHHPLRLSLLLLLAEISVNDSPIAKGDAATADTYIQLAGALIGSQFPGRWFDRARCDSIRGQLLHVEGRLLEAESTLRGALQSWTCGEDQLGAAHPENASTMLALAALYVGLDHRGDAEQLSTTVATTLLAMKETPETIALELNRRGNSYYARSLWREAEWWYSKSEALYAKSLGDLHPSTIQLKQNRERAASKLRPSE